MHVIDIAEHHDRRTIRSEQLEGMWRRIRPLMPKARRFVFDKEASAFVGAFIRDFGPTLLENLQFAIPPFETCYIEYHLDALLDTIGARMVGMEGPKYPNAPDERIGHLIDGKQVHSFIQGSDREASYYPVIIGLHTETYTRGMFDNTNLAMDIRKKLAYVLGSTANGLMVGGDTARDWTHHVDVWPVDNIFQGLLRNDLLRDSGNGTVRNLVALLLMLNRQRERVTLTQVPPKGVIYKGKRKVFMAHSLVTLTTEDYGAITRSFSPTGHHESPRRHQVRGFFRHYHRVRGCEHAFLEEGRPDRWVCQHCGTVRVWVHDHERGDASKGYVTKEYVVTDPAADGNN